jgi:hypothetical protein
MVPGADALLATSLSMCLFNVVKQVWPAQGAADSTVGNKTPVHTSASTANTSTVAAAVKPFCSYRTHDFAVPSSANDFAVNLIEAERWDELADTLASLSSSERQGFFASFDYGQLVAPSDKDDTGKRLVGFTNALPHNADAHVLFGHYQLCEAKRMGLQPGAIPDADSAAALAVAFRHFRLALRLSPDHTEAMCGLILAKGFTGLSDEHIEKSLQRLLEVDPLHFHGLVAAACFVVRSTAGANRFVSVVERSVGEDNATAALARIVAHVECMIGTNSNPLLNSATTADLHRQLRVYNRDAATLGLWQQAISNNIIAFAFEKIGDDQEREHYLARAKGLLSPYPWQRSVLLAEEPES